MYASRFVPLLQRSAVLTGAAVYHAKFANCDKSKEEIHKAAHEHVLKTIRPSLDEYDPVPWDIKKNEKMIKHHALLETLHGENMVETYEVYKHKVNQEIYVVLKFGKTLNGYPGILHGGISALVLDNSYGMLFMSLGLPPAFTANLDINYRIPIKQNSYCILRAKVDSIHGRKLRMSAQLEDPITGKVQVESTTLFVNMKLTYWQQALKGVMDYFYIQ